MLCPRCGKSVGTTAQLCQSCAKLPAQPLQPGFSSSSNGPTFQVGEIVTNKYFIGLLILTVFIAYQFGVFGFGYLPKPHLLSSSGYVSDPCDNKERCVVVYVAPWCPACKGAIGFMNGVYARLAQSPKVGMKVIVGMDQPSRLSQMASSFRAPTFLDPERKFSSKAKISGVPSVWVTNQEGKILRRGIPGALSGGASEEDLYSHYFDKYLKIREFL